VFKQSLQGVAEERKQEAKINLKRKEEQKKESRILLNLSWNQIPGHCWHAYATRILLS
jgi:ABC-type molybdenum transport system ATPase subunit/photorepair protein PhrA